MNICIFGHVCIDKNISEHSSYVGAGSPAIFMNKIFRQFPDCNVNIIAPYGVDYLPYLKDVLIYPKKPNCQQTLIYENISRSGSRIQKAHNREEATPVFIDDELVKIIKKAELIFLAPLLPNFSPDYFQQISSIKRKDAFTILLPQGYYRSFDSEDRVVVRNFNEEDIILAEVNAVIVSEEDHLQMIDEAKKWVDKHNLTSIITLGERGAIAINSKENINLPARPVAESEIVDSVGSGDIFSAGFGYRYKQTGDIKEAGRFANEIARQCLFFPAGKIKINFLKLF